MSRTLYQLFILIENVDNMDRATQIKMSSGVGVWPRFFVLLTRQRKNCFQWKFSEYRAPGCIC